MAKYEVTFSCGHTGTVELFGKIADREDKLRWYETSAVCPECYKAQQQAKTDEFNASLPALTGSEKQISWAKDIRAKAVKDSFFVKKYFSVISSETSAKWWIENRFNFESICTERLEKDARIKKAAKAKALTKSQIFKGAHAMAKKIKADHPEVDYRAQFSICLKAAYEYLKSVIAAAA